MLELLTFILVAMVPTFSVADVTRTYEFKGLADTYFKAPADEFNNGQVHARAKFKKTSDKAESLIDFGVGGLSGLETEYYFILPQAYFEQKLENATITFGRKVKSFSTMDEYWKLGDVQPLFRWDAPHPELQGLTGLFSDIKINRNLDLHLFASTIYLPTQGPSYTLNGGRLTTGNPWFAQPIDILLFSAGQPYTLSYDIDTPDVGTLVLQPSWGAGFTLKSDNEALWMRAQYFYKTKNELVIPFEPVLNISNRTGTITVHPVAAHHRLTTADIGYKADKWSLTFSGMAETSISYEAQDPWIYPAYSDQYRAAMSLMIQATENHTLQFGALKTYHNTVTGKGISGVGNIDIYTYRNQYDDAVDVRLDSVFHQTSFGYRFNTKMRYAYDYEAETSLVSLQASYMPMAGLDLFVLTDLFGGVRDLSEAYNNLLVNYLNRDRAVLGVRYVF